MHKLNHPHTEDYCESVWGVDPVEVVNGRKVGLCCLSTDCKHFSKAIGAKPVNKTIRGLAWIAHRWAIQRIKNDGVNYVPLTELLSFVQSEEVEDEDELDEILQAIKNDTLDEDSE
ncbi:hypothetical protein DH09_01025 (plasmid) [Bacillaceae bacterium JMAK1]|nr:hypothetical protein DH09_01025 [Bacillaceae bacterium JMAK1]